MDKPSLCVVLASFALFGGIISCKQTETAVAPATTASPITTAPATTTVAPSSTPTITGFSPTNGAAGTVVIISGTNFSTTPSANTVTINGIQAVVSAAMATALTVTVPTGATTGVVSVKVGSAAATSASNFTISTVSTTVALTNAVMKPWFDTYCSSCHAAGKSDQSRWLYNPSNYTTSIKGNIVQIHSEVYVHRSMPQGTTLSATELTAFKAWYDNGYPAQ